MSKIRNDKIDGNWYTDEYIRMLIDTIEKKNKIINKAIEYIKSRLSVPHYEIFGLKIIDILEGKDK